MTAATTETPPALVLTAAQAAEVLQVTERRIGELRRAGHLAGVYMGTRSYRYRYAELAAFAAGGGAPRD